MSDLWEAGYDAGERAMREKLQPLFDAVNDAAFMFADIEKARELPSYGGAVMGQYKMMGRELRRLLAAYGLARE